MLCPTCQADNLDQATICYKCGNKLRNNDEVQVETKPSVLTAVETPSPENKFTVRPKKDTRPKEATDLSRLVTDSPQPQANNVSPVEQKTVVPSGEQKEQESLNETVESPPSPRIESEMQREEKLAIPSPQVNPVSDTPKKEVVPPFRQTGAAIYTPLLVGLLAAIFGAATGGFLLAYNLEQMGQKEKGKKLFFLSLGFVAFLTFMILFFPSINYLIIGLATWLFFFFLFKNDYAVWRKVNSLQARPGIKTTILMIVKGLGLTILIFFVEGIIYSLVRG